MKNQSKSTKNFLYIILGLAIGVLLVLMILKYTNLLTNTSIIKTNNGKTIVEKNSISDAVDKAKGAVVMIEGYKNGELASTGTGFVYKTDATYGYIMTNEHVIDGTEKITVIMSNDEEVEATPMGYEYRGTVTSGILSGKDRMVSVSIGNNSNTEDYVMKVLQTDAAINPGNSGGPLLNINGEVIGINSLKLVEEEIEGMGFAIPIEYAMSHVDSLEQKKSIDWPVLGISMLNVKDTASLYRNNINIPANIKSGVVVISITENSGASKSDLRAGDIIIEMNGEKVENIAYLRYELYKYTPGETIEVSYIRDNKEHKTKVTLSKNVNPGS